MSSHIGVLPVDVLDALSAQLDEAQSCRFLRLPHPRTGIPSLFLPHPNSFQGEVNSSAPDIRTSILEAQIVAPPNARSWFMGEGQVLEDGKLLIMTPIDPAFLLIPILQATYPTDGTPGTFRPLDDVFEDAIPKLVETAGTSGTPKDPSSLLSTQDLQIFTSLACTKAAMKRICEVKEITPEIVVYRYSPVRLIEYLSKKVQRLSQPEVCEISRTVIRGFAKDGLMEDGKEQLLQPARIKAACDLISQYVPSDIHSRLLAAYDFTCLDTHLKAMQDEITALSLANTNSGDAKVKGEDDPNDNKKRKNQKGSHGVEKLKKANTKGMAKLSSFFQKAKA